MAVNQPALAGRRNPNGGQTGKRFRWSRNRIALTLPPAKSVGVET